jgi:cell division protein FtsL
MAADPIVAPPRPRPRAPQRPRLRPAPPPRRVSGAGGAVAAPAPIPLRRPLDLLRGLPDSKLLDRLLRGQGWVVLIGVALMGIVALQVSLLKMNAGIGQSIERGAHLERQNADLRAEVSKLSSEERIASVAGRLGLVMSDANEFRYVEVRGAVDARKAASVMRAPDPVEQPITTSTSAAATPAATTTTAPTTTTTTAPASGTTATAPPATTTAPAQTAPTVPQTPTQATPTGTTSGATAAPAGTPTAPGQ